MEIHRPRLSSRDLRDSLTFTLRGLCSKEPSVTHVCKETGINRQQFAKYLDGRSMPSFENAMRIADYFDITCEELFGFRTVSHIAGFELPDLAAKGSMGYKAKQAIEKIEQISEYIEMPKLGYYLCYVNSASDDPAFKHSYLKSLTRFDRVGDEIVIERRQYLQKNMGFSKTKIKYYGVGHVVHNMLSIRYCNPVENDHLGFILVRPQDSHGNNLTGIILDRGNAHGGEAGASAVFFEFLGTKPDLRAAVSNCGMFRHGEGLLKSEIEQVLKAQIRDDQFAIAVR